MTTKEFEALRTYVHEVEQAALALTGNVEYSDGDAWQPSGKNSRARSVELAKVLRETIMCEAADRVKWPDNYEAGR